MQVMVSQTIILGALSLTLVCHINHVVCLSVITNLKT